MRSLKTIIMTMLGMLLFSSCGLKLKDHQKVQGGRQFDSTDSVFISYIQKFEQQGKSQTGNSSFNIGDVPINFADLPEGDVQGVCNEYEDGSKEILIKRSWWNSMDEGYKESLLFHELGHCRLGRSHHDEMIQVGNVQYKESMMHTYIVDSTEYIMLQQAYFKELFTQDHTALVNSLNASVSNK